MNNGNTRDKNNKNDKQAQELIALLNQMERRPAAKKPAAKPITSSRQAVPEMMAFFALLTFFT